MRKLYTLALAFATLAATAVTPRHIDESKLPPLRTLEECLADTQSNFHRLGTESFSKETKQTNRLEPITNMPVDTILGEWEGTNDPMINGVAKKDGLATIQADGYGDYEIEFANCWAGYFNPCFKWNGTKGELTFAFEGFTKLSDGTFIYQAPLNGTSLVETVVATFNGKNQTIEFPQGSGLAFIRINSSAQILGYYWAVNNITLERPKGDYKLIINSEDECNATNRFTFSITAGADVASVKAIMMEGDYAANDFVEYGLMDLYGESIKTDTEYVLTPEKQMEATGHYTLAIAAYNADNEVVRTADKTYIVVLNEIEKWTPVATMEYTDGLIAQYYSNFAHTKEAAELQECIEQPGLFRLVNPYEGQQTIHADGCNHYLYLDTRDAEYVGIPTSPTGMDWGDGVLCLGTFHALGYDKENAKAKELPMGTKSGRTLTFPVKSILAHESLYNDHGKWSYVPSETPYSITLPDVELTVTVLDSDGTPLEGYAVSSGETTATTGANGVVTLGLDDNVDYLDTVTVSATKGDDNIIAYVKLTGAENETTIKKESAGIDNVSKDNEAIEYYNLQGVRVDNPTVGLYIRKQGGKATKVVL